MSGILIGVGVGPGDPEQMTLKAVRVIRENEVIAVPGNDAKETVAYRIAVQAVPELEKKTLLALPMPMIKDRAELAKNHDAAALQVENVLKEGRISDTWRPDGVFDLHVCPQPGEGTRLCDTDRERYPVILRGSGADGYLPD